MRRKEREVTDKNEIYDILQRADVCRVAFAVNSVPYIVAMNYGLEQRNDDEFTLYFHCAREGKKLDMMRQNNLVCFQVDIDHELHYIPEKVYCTMRYSSVVGMGYLEEVTDEAERVKGLDLLMQHHGHEAPMAYPPSSMTRTVVLRLKITEISAKKNAAK